MNKSTFLQALIAACAAQGISLVKFDESTVKSVSKDMYARDLGNPPTNAIILTDGRETDTAPGRRNKLHIGNPTFVVVAVPQGDGIVRIEGCYLCSKKSNHDTMKKRVDKHLAQYGKREPRKREDLHGLRGELAFA